MKSLRTLIALVVTLAAPHICAADDTATPTPYAWTVSSFFANRVEVPIDTLFANYAQTNVPSLQSSAYATTGNLGCEGINMIFSERPEMSTFFFKDALNPWLPTTTGATFYNTRIPMTLLSYNTGGGRDNSQDRLKAVFSGNINKRSQVGAFIDYLYSKGSYNYQASNDLSWGFNGSYLGDKFEFEGYFYHYNMLNKENGGITDDLYITDPAEIQGGSSSIDTKNIPTNLTASHSKVVGTQAHGIARYKLGFWDEKTVDDTIKVRTYVPVTTFSYQVAYTDNKHIFKNTNPTQNIGFWDNTYIDLEETYDRTTFWQFREIAAIQLLEGFNKWAKAGLGAYLRHDIRHYGQSPDNVAIDQSRPEGLTPYPYATKVNPVTHFNLVSVGFELARRQGRYINYGATIDIGLIGIPGEIVADGWLDTKFKLFGDTVNIRAYGDFHNESQHSLITNYVSNHFIWHNDFGNTKRFKFGGTLTLPHTGTMIDVNFETLKDYVYFGPACLPVQCNDNVQVFTASLQQNVRAGVFNWDNRITYQTSSNQEVIPIPALAVYSNMYVMFKIARVLDVQLGIDCDYYTRYKAPGYQPATMSFYNQREIDCGNYPFMNAYINFKLSKARFYVMMSHVNQGLFGDNYFSMPHYPLNPRRFQLGVSVDFAN